MQQIITFKSLYSAYRDCRRYKRHTANAQRYEMALLDNLFNMQTVLQNRSYSPTRSIRFVARNPKAREIYAADFSDRVVHHWLIPQLDRLFEPIFIHDLYSNRKGKGTHQAVKRLQAFMHSVQSKQKPHQGWYLQLDIANFFNTIDKPLLFKLLQQRLRKAIQQKKITLQEAQVLRWLSHVMLKHDTTEHAYYRGSPSLLKHVPKYKQLGQSGEDKGLPIGNLTSQFFANVYLNPLDQFIKHKLKCKHYLRYVDDFILLADSQATLLQWREEVQCYIQDVLKLQLKEISPPRPVKSGADFLGYITFPHYRLVRRRVVGNLHEKLKHYQQQVLLGSVEQGYKLILHTTVIHSLRATLASYWGHFAHAESYTLRQMLFQRFLWLGLLFKQHEMPKKISVVPCWEPPAWQVTGYKAQIRFFHRHYPYAKLSVQRGTEQDDFSPLALQNVGWISAAHPPDVAGTKALPPSLCKKLGQHTMNKKPPDDTDLMKDIKTSVLTVHIKENGYLKGGLKRRQIFRLQLKPGVELCPHT